jgi:outer membrane protein assembly factor BamB
LGSASAQDAKRATSVNWLQYRRDNQRSGFDPYETQITPATVAGLYATAITGVTFDIGAAPVVYKGLVYIVAPSWIDPDSVKDEMTVYAFDAITGVKKWTYVVGCRSGAGGNPGISTTANALIVSMTAGCGSSTGSGSLLALNPYTGALKWSMSPNFSGTPAIVGSTVYVTAADPYPTYMMSINAATGAINWTIDPEPEAEFSDPTVASGVIYVREGFGCGWGAPVCAGQLTAINANTGARLWTKGSATGDPSVAGSKIYVACDLGVCAYNTSGVLRWSTEGSAGAEVAIANGKAYMTCDTESLCAVNATTGAFAWKTDLSTLIYPQIDVYSPVVAGGVVYVGTSSCCVAAFDAATGAYLWTMGPPGVRNPIVLNGKAYFVSENRLYIYGL